MVQELKDFFNSDFGRSIGLIMIVSFLASVVHGIKKKYKFIEFVKYYITTLIISALVYLVLVYQFELKVTTIIPILLVIGMYSDVLYKEGEKFFSGLSDLLTDFIKSKIGIKKDE